MARIDPYKHEERYLRWKREQGARIPNTSKANAEIIRKFVFDLELGLNVSRSSKRGPRSYIRLNTLRTRIPTIARLLEQRFGLDTVTCVSEEQLHELINEMRTGVIRKENGERYASLRDLVKDFRTFWHWHMSVQRKAGHTIPDVSHYLDARQEKPRWVYLTENQVRRLCEEAKYEYRVLIMFLLDSGIRSPTELVNIRVADFCEDFKKLNIREEISKTFGRRINLMLCSSLMREYVGGKNLRDQDVVFPISPPVVNRYLQRLAERVFGKDVTLGGDQYSKLTMYDFRHVSACYWAVRYKSESALKYRFGWTKTERIQYYTDFLGMSDTIKEDDVLINADKTAIEK